MASSSPLDVQVVGFVYQNGAEGATWVSAMPCALPVEYVYTVAVTSIDLQVMCVGICTVNLSLSQQPTLPCQLHIPSAYHVTLSAAINISHPRITTCRVCLDSVSTFQSVPSLPFPPSGLLPLVFSPPFWLPLLLWSMSSGEQRHNRK